jgi:acyl-CoA dehydrogenase
MNFEIPEEYRMLNDSIARFVKEELIPLEPKVLERESQGKSSELTEEEISRIDAKAKELGFWGLDAPTELGGADLPFLAMIGVHERMAYSAVHYEFSPDSANSRMLLLNGSEHQKAKYLAPYVRGEIRGAIVISEPGAGADPSGMTTRAIRDGDHYVINGRKIWISFLGNADFGLVMARTGDQRGARDGISAFIVDTNTPGFKIERRIPMLGGRFTYEVVFEDCRVHESNLLGVEGKGFDPMKERLGSRRIQMACWCVGRAQRALDMLCEYAPQRKTFGQPLSERQAIQWWIADAATRIHACRLMIQEAAWRLDNGIDAKSQLSMVKVAATEMAWEVIDHAMQVFGGMGMTKEMPLHLMATEARLTRVYEGPNEVHRMVIARNALAGFR